MIIKYKILNQSNVSCYSCNSNSNVSCKVLIRSSFIIISSKSQFTGHPIHPINSNTIFLFFSNKYY